MVIHDVEADQTITYNDEGSCEPIVRGVQRLEDAGIIVGHNVIGYDIPVVKKLYPWFNPSGDVVDTLVLSRLYHANMLRVDQNKEWDHMPVQLYGRHSLESYGYRLGEFKGNFSKTTDWKNWSEEMQEYCIQDVVVTKKLCEHFHPYLTGAR